MNFVYVIFLHFIIIRFSSFLSSSGILESVCGIYNLDWISHIFAIQHSLLELKAVAFAKLS